MAPYTTDVTLKYARLLKIGIWALRQEMTPFIVSKFENTTCIGSRPVKLKTVPKGILSHLSGMPLSFSKIVLFEIGQPDY